MPSPNENGVPAGSIDVAAALGAEPGVYIECFSVYVPSKDRNGVAIETQRAWVLEALALLGAIGGGATAMPPVQGTWRNLQGEFVWDDPVVVYSHVDPHLFAENLPRLREFLHRLGRTTNQGEVAFEFGNRFFRIRVFDAP